VADANLADDIIYVIRNHTPAFLALVNVLISHPK
jgi:hypothetical protein